MRLSGRTGGLVLLAVFLAIAILLPSGSGEAPDGSILSSRPGGRRAAYLLLAGLGLGAEEWRRPPDHLPDGGALLILPRAPRALAPPHLDRAGEDGGEDGEEEAAPAAVGAADDDPLEDVRVRTLWGYRRFVEAGGVLLLAEGRAERELLRELEIDEIAWLDFEDEAGAADARGLGDAFELEGWKRRGDPVEEWAEGAVAPLLADADGRALGWRVDVGRGAVAWLADDGFLRNDRIGSADHGRLLVRLVEELGAAGPVWFDEYAAGRWSPGGAADLLAGPALGPATLHVLLLGLVATWLAAWAADFPRDPPPLSRLSPLARAEALASLCLRGRRASLLAQWLRAGVWRRVVAAARVAGAEPEPSREGAERLAERLAARGLPDAAAQRLSAAFAPAACEDAGELADLDERLRAVERDVAALDASAAR